MGVVIYYLRNGRTSEENLRASAAHYTGQAVEGWTIVRQPQEKPAFLYHPQVQFSISHSGDLWACAFSDRPVGLDVQIHGTRNFSGIARRFFAPGENTFLFERGYDASLFYHIWTAKESYVKLLGCGMNLVFSAFDVLKPLPDGAVLQRIRCPEGFSACLCTFGTADVTVVDLI